MAKKPNDDEMRGVDVEIRRERLRPHERRDTQRPTRQIAYESIGGNIALGGGHQVERCPGLDDDERRDDD